MKLTDDLRKEYESLFASCVVDPKRKEYVELAIDQILRWKDRYAAAAAPLGLPFYVVGILHYRECGSPADFSCHLANGDPLLHRTVNVPKGRPIDGNPPFTWEQSAADALTYQGLDAWKDWSVAGTLFVLEKWNGFGPRQIHHIHTGYLWSLSQHYHGGKYIADGAWSPTAIDKQAGAATVLKQMNDQSLIAFPTTPPHADCESLPPSSDGEPLL